MGHQWVLLFLKVVKNKGLDDKALLVGVILSFIGGVIGAPNDLCTCICFFPPTIFHIPWKYFLFILADFLYIGLLGGF
ncbi:hypothetical protein KHA80_21335 [Anaerobacillus sp. HL2]|nr:hypothetical protein KHA80_21335 [Anaerobacillus sp. HL2]